MKFAHYITVLERDAPSQWRGKFVKYKQLKKMLKRCKPADQPDAPLDTEAEEAFFKELHSELEAINRDFQLEADRTVAAYHRSTQGCHFFFCFIPLCCFSGPKQYAALSERAYWCRKYARGNAVALRKILKKHDKVCGNRRGREFLQQCWCSASAAGIGLFLHSPLLDELKAVQDVLQHKITEIEIKNKTTDEEHHHLDGDDSDFPSDGEAAQHKNTLTGSNNGKLNQANKVNSDNSTTTAPIPANTTSITTTTTTAVCNGVPAVIGLPPPPSISSSTTNTTTTTAPNRTTNAHRTSLNLSRLSPSGQSQSSDGLRGAVAGAFTSTQTHPIPLAPPSMSGSLGSQTSPSLQAQRRAALVAIQESPTCMLDSSDIEWEGGEEEESGGGCGVSAINGQVISGRGANNQPIASPRGATTLPGLVENGDHEEDENIHDVTSDAGERDGIDPDAPLINEGAAGENGIIGDVGSRSGGGGGGNAPAGGAGSFPDGGSSGVGLVLGPFRDEELRCPICLDVMYKPVGLGCGHKFCSPCALEAAGFGKAFGAFHNIISYIPTRIPCPQCRQKNVYKSAVALREVGRLIKSRYPEQWAERKAEERRKRREAGNGSDLSRERITSLLGTTPFDLLM